MSDAPTFSDSQTIVSMPLDSNLSIILVNYNGCQKRGLAISQPNSDKNVNGQLIFVLATGQKLNFISRTRNSVPRLSSVTLW